MSYELLLQDRPAGQIATIQGLADLQNAVDLRTGQLGKLMREGKTDDPLKLRREIKELLAGGRGLFFSVGQKSILKAILDALPDRGTVSISPE